MTYMAKQRRFDTEVKRKKRKFTYNKHIEIETIQTENPRQFWEQIKRLGPKKTFEIPMAVISENGEINKDQSDVLKKWEADFKSLFNKAKASENANFDETFYEEVMQYKNDLEIHMRSNNINETNEQEELNRQITIAEVEKVVRKQ